MTGQETLFVADYDGSQIRMITPQGVVTTLAGSGARGSFNNTGIVATFNRPTGLTVDGSGNLYVADTYSTVIRVVITTGYSIDKPLPFGLVFDSSTGIISGTPTQATPTTIYTITGYNEAGNYSTQVTISVIGSISPPVLPPAITYTTPMCTQRVR